MFGQVQRVGHVQLQIINERSDQRWMTYCTRRTPRNDIAVAKQIIVKRISVHVTQRLGTVPLYVSFMRYHCKDGRAGSTSLGSQLREQRPKDVWGIEKAHLLRPDAKQRSGGQNDIERRPPRGPGGYMSPISFSKPLDKGQWRVYIEHRSKRSPQSAYANKRE
jgi:hypothetical protein